MTSWLHLQFILLYQLTYTLYSTCMYLSISCTTWLQISTFSSPNFISSTSASYFVLSTVKRFQNVAEQADQASTK